MWKYMYIFPRHDTRSQWNNTISSIFFLIILTSGIQVSASFSNRIRTEYKQYMHKIQRLKEFYPV